MHAGTLNLSSRLEVRVERTGEDTRVGRLMKLVEEHARAPRAHRAARRPHRGALRGRGAGPGRDDLRRSGARVDVGRAVDHAVALLIVTCPCALGLATPLALSAAIGQAARAGFLIKGADVLEKLARPGRMWLDKTGTLTEGRAALLAWWGEPVAKTLVAAAEAHSVAPAGAGARGRGRRLAPGLSGRRSPRRTAAASRGAWPGARGLWARPTSWRRASARSRPSSPARSRAPGGRAHPGARGGGRRAWWRPPASVIRCARTRRPRSRASAALGWRVGILSGDDPVVVGAVGRRLGLGARDCRGGVSPEGKLRAVEDGTPPAGRS